MKTRYNKGDRIPQLKHQNMFKVAGGTKNKCGNIYLKYAQKA